MSVRLSEDEAWDVLEHAHTGILTTLQRDGRPVALPVWFVVIDRRICFRTPSRAKKITRVRRDPRVSFLVESGERWAELRAVHVAGDVELVEDEAARARIEAAMDEKYAAYRTPKSQMSDGARAQYADFAYLQLTPAPRMLTWDNRRA
ncbi:MAG: pyridoxamine 5'-phosphate oxidase family protein [Acidimicrobiia bacterium]